MKGVRGCSIMALLLFLAGPQAQAKAKEEYKMNINISGTVIVTGKCTFDNKGALSAVNFGDVRFNALHALVGSYRKSLASGMSCSGDTTGAQMIFSSLDNSSVSYQGKALLSVKDANTGQQSPDLAIRLWVNDVVQNINTHFAVNMASQPKLEAELIQIGDGKSFVSGAGFSASATLMLLFI